MLETIKQHLRILMLKQYSTGKNSGASWTLLSAGGRAQPHDWGEGGPYFWFYKVGRYDMGYLHGWHVVCTLQLLPGSFNMAKTPTMPACYLFLSWYTSNL